MSSAFTVQRAGLMAGFTCLGPACEDTCCAGWGMQVDPERIARYAALGLQDAVEAVPGGWVMRRDPQGERCLQLRGGRCGIQLDHGADALTDACHLYPRVLRSVAGEVWEGAVLSCPEVARRALYGDADASPRSGEIDRLPAGMRAYAPGETPSSARAALADALKLARMAPSASVALVQLEARARGTSWDGRGAPLDVRDVQRLLLVLAGLQRSTNLPPSPRGLDLEAAIAQALRLRIEPQTLDLLGDTRSAEAAERALERWPGIARALRRPLKGWLAAQLVGSAFPFAGLGADAAERIHILGLKLALLRLALVTLLPEGPPPEAQVVTLTQVTAKITDHLSDVRLLLSLLDEMGWRGPERFAGLVGAV